MKTIARLLAFLSVAPSSLLYVRIRAPIYPLRGSLWILRLLAEAITPFIALSGAVAAGLGLLARAPLAMLTGALGGRARCAAGDSPAPRLCAGLWRGVGGAYCARAADRDDAAGGTPETVPDRYALFSPITHVQPGSPPTLLIQGKDDVIAPVSATNLLYEQLVAAGVPAANIVFPHAEHGFDLVLPRWSPAAQTAWYYQERSLALML